MTPDPRAELAKVLRDALHDGDPLRPTGHDDACDGSCPRDRHGVPECRR